MKLKEFVLGAAIAVGSGCNPSAKSAILAQPKAPSSIPSPQEHTDSNLEIFAELKQEDKKMNDPMQDILRNAGLKLHICMQQNAELETQLGNIVEPLINIEEVIKHEGEFAACGPDPKSESWWNCADKILIQQGKIKELIQLYRVSNELNSKLIACVNDTSRWDPALTESDYQGMNLINHPDPDIQKLVKAASNAAPDSNPAVQKLSDKHGHKVVYQARTNCYKEPSIDQCYEGAEAADRAFSNNPTKQRRIDQLQKSVECDSLVNACIERELSGKKSSGSN